MVATSYRKTASLLLLVAILLKACSSNSASPLPVASEQPAASKHYGTEWTAYRTTLQHFIEGLLTGPNGVYTNYIETNQKSEAATGHESLSESAGLLLQYYANTGQRAAFDAAWEVARRTFDTDDFFAYRYSPLLNKQYSVNAAVDDLRLIRALHDAAAVFKEDHYEQAANAYGERFVSHNIKEDRLYDFYDGQYGRTNDFITLCYIDFKALSKLPQSLKKTESLLKRMYTIAEGGYISDNFPFYQTRYDYASQTYQSDAIQTVESLLTILHLAQMGREQPASISFLKQLVDGGTLYGQYTKNGQPANDIRSTALYAIAALIGSVIQDQTLYDSAIARMNEFRVQDSMSPLFGGFGDPVSGQAYSFDNLMALLAYSY